MALVMTASIRAIITTMRTHNYCNNGINIRRGEQVMLNCGDDDGVTMKHLMVKVNFC